MSIKIDFYSRPCGRGDARLRMLLCFLPQFLLTPLREGRRSCPPQDKRAP